MKISIISIIEECSNPAEGFRGLVPLCGKPLAAYQADQALKVGCDKIIFAVEAMHGALLSLVDELKKRGADIEIVRKPSELPGQVSSEDELLVFRDGQYCAASIAAHVSQYEGDVVAVFGNSPATEQFERLDLNHHWAGILKIGGSKAATLLDLPEGWSVESALLRQAVQDGCHRLDLDERHILDGNVRSLSGVDEANEIAIHMIKGNDQNNDGLIEQAFFWPVQRKILPKLWAWPKSKLALIGSTIAAGLAGVTLGWASFPGAAALLFFVGNFALYSAQNSEIYDNKFDRINVLKYSYYLSIIIGLILSIYSSFSYLKLYHYLWVGGVLAGLLVLANATPMSAKHRKWIPDLNIALLGISVSAFAGYFGEGLSAVSLVLLSALVINALVSRRNS